MVLITGASGFVGSFAVEHYLRAGWTVHGTSRRPSAEASLSGPNIHRLDLTDPVATRALVDAVRPRVVLHLAAESSTSRSWQDPLGTYRNNVLSQLSLLEACVSIGGVERVLVAGSADEYGSPEPDDSPIREDYRLLPVTPYGVSKVAQDLMGYQYFAAHGLPVIRVRPFLQVGPRRSETFFSGAFARQIAEAELGLRPPEMQVGDIDRVRDLTDVRDVVRALALLAEQGEVGAVYNIASGQGRPVRDLLDMLLDLAAVRPEVHRAPSEHRALEPAVLVGDVSRLRGDTGWAPSISLRDSARDLLDYWRRRLETEGAKEDATS